MRWPAFLFALAALSCADDGPRLSKPLLAALAQARSYHHIADLRLADGDRAAASAALEKILGLAFPAGAPEGEDAVLDARARLAKLHLADGRAADARRIVDEGLAAARRESFFLANLHAVSGELLEAEAKAAADPEVARARRKAAILAHERSIAINERIQKQLLEEGRRRRRAGWWSYASRRAAPPRCRGLRRRAATSAATTCARSMPGSWRTAASWASRPNRRRRW